jgi:hypothetical protein
MHEGLQGNSRKKSLMTKKLWGIHYIEVSAKADVNVKEAVLTLLKLVPLLCEVPQVFPTVPQHQSFLSWLWSFFSW